MNETTLRFLTIVNTILFIVAISMLGMLWWKGDSVSQQTPSTDFELQTQLLMGFAEYYNSLPEKRRECIQKNVLSEERLSQLLKDSPPLGSVSLTEEETLQMQNCIRQYK